MRSNSSPGGPHADSAIRVSVIVIAVVLTFAALRTGGDIFAPMVLATVSGVMLAPLSDMFERAGLPPGLAAAVVLVLGILGIAVIAILVEPIIWRVVEELPRIKWELRAIVEEFRNLIRGLDEVNREVGEALGTEDTAASGEKDEAPIMPKLHNALFLAPRLVAQILIFGGTLFFFLYTRKGIYVWLSRWIGRSADTAIIMRRFTRAERLVARYFLTVSIINAGLGAALGGALVIIGLPAPLIWAIAAALLNFILYVGPMTMIAGLLFAGLIAFDGMMVAVPAFIFLCLNTIEAQFVTPALVGRHIAVNPLLIFVSLVVWLWLWGPVGAIIAIPVLVITLVMLDIFDPEAERDEAPCPEPETP